MSARPVTGPAEIIAPLLNLTADQLLRLGRDRKVPKIPLGHRTVHFDEAKCRAAIERLEIKEIK